jgi:hypothetical protein
MSIAISEEQVMELVRAELAKEVANLRPLIRGQLLEEMEFVTEEEGVAILKIAGKEPIRSFRRLMNDYGVHRIQLVGRWLYKRLGEHSVMSALDKLTVKPKARKLGSGLLSIYA